MPDRGAMLSPQILTIFPSNNLTPPERRKGVGWMAGQVGVGLVVRVGVGWIWGEGDGDGASGVGGGVEQWSHAAKSLGLLGLCEIWARLTTIYPMSRGMCSALRGIAAGVGPRGNDCVSVGVIDMCLGGCVYAAG